MVKLSVFVFLGEGEVKGELTLHSVFHVLGKQGPHDLCRHLPHVQLLGEPEGWGKVDVEMRDERERSLLGK